MQLQLSAAAVLLAGILSASASATPNAKANANANAGVLMSSHNVASRAFLESAGIFRRAAVEYDDETSFSIGEEEEEEFADVMDAEVDDKCFLKHCQSDKNWAKVATECNFPANLTASDRTNYAPTEEEATCLCKSRTYVQDYNE